MTQLTVHSNGAALAEAQKLVAKDLKKLYKGDTTSQEVVRDFTRTARSLADDLPGRMLPILDTSVVAAAATWSERLNAVMLEAQSEVTQRPCVTSLWTARVSPSAAPV